MTVAELLPELSHLNRVDKLRVMQHLASELVSEDEAGLAHQGDYAVWSPHNDFKAAEVLLSALAEEKRVMHE